MEPVSILGAGLIDVLNSKVGELENVVQAGLVLLAIIFIGYTWVKSKALVPTLGAIVMAAIVIFAVSDSGRDTLGRLIGDEVNEAPESTTGTTRAPQ